MDSNDRDNDTTRPVQGAVPKAKRVYAKPELVEYGNVRDLTRGNSTKSFDYHASTRKAT